MFKKTLTAAVAALTLAGATVTTTSSAQAGGFGRAVAFGAAGFAVGALAAGAAAARPVYYAPAYRPCGSVATPVYDAFGNPVGYRRVAAC